MSKCLPCKVAASDSRAKPNSSPTTQDSESSGKPPSSTQRINNNPHGEKHPFYNGDVGLMENTKSDTQSSRKLKRNFSLPLSVNSATNGEGAPTLPPPKSSWLLRLFESKMFDMSIAVAYLFNSKETGVLTYLGNKLFVSTTDWEWFESFLSAWSSNAWLGVQH